MVTIYQPTAESIRAQAEAAQRAEQERKDRPRTGGGGDLPFGNFADGDNIQRILPSTNSRGVIGKRLVKHTFKNTSMASLLEKNMRCVAGSHPELGLKCEFCTVAESLHKSYPQLDLGRWAKQSPEWYLQAFPRASQEPIAKIFRYTEPTYNKLILLMDKIQTDNGINIVNLESGMDINVLVTKETKGKRTFPAYAINPWGFTGPTPLHKDPAFVNQILESMRDLDAIWKAPDDESLADLRSNAMKVKTFFEMKSAKPNVQVPSNFNPAPPVQAAAPQAQPQVTMPAYTPPSQVTTQVTTPVVESRTAPAVQQALAQSVPVAAPVQQSLPIVNNMPANTTTGANAPTDRPKCFAGAAPRADNGVGYSDESELCLTCKFELQCMELCSKRA